MASGRNKLSIGPRGAILAASIATAALGVGYLAIQKPTQDTRDRVAIVLREDQQDSGERITHPKPNIPQFVSLTAGLPVVENSVPEQKASPDSGSGINYSTVEYSELLILVKNGDKEAIAAFSKESAKDIKHVKSKTEGPPADSGRKWIDEHEHIRTDYENQWDTLLELLENQAKVDPFHPAFLAELNMNAEDLKDFVQVVVINVTNYDPYVDHSRITALEISYQIQ